MFALNKGIVILSAAVIALAGLVGSAAADMEANKETYRRINQEAWSQGQMAVVDEFVADDYVYHEQALGDFHGPDGLKQSIMAYRTAYPDLQFTVDDIMVEGNLVVARWSANGTHEGELFGIPATGLKTTTYGINLARFNAEGKIVEEWSSWDSMGLMQQLGVVVPPRAGPDSYVWEPDSDVTGDPGDPALNRLLVMRVNTQFWNSKDIAGLVDTHSPDAIAHNGALPESPLDFEAYQQACLAQVAAMPDLLVTTEALVAEADKVAVRWTVTGTQQGELLGIPASGKAVQFKGITIYRLADGKVVESWWAYDALGMMQQITTPPEYSPVGIWIVTVPTPAGVQTWMHCISSPEQPGGACPGVFMTANENPTNYGMFPDVEIGSSWVSLNRRTGPNTMESTLMGYGARKGESPVAETAVIYVAHGQWMLTGPNTNEGTAVTAVYTADQDVDGDGFPDEGQEPVACMPFTFTSRRVTAISPPCVPEQP
jgi:steroid delta-isomerase-like uncharacterized protein